MTINLNELVRVKLTEYGKEILNNYDLKNFQMLKEYNFSFDEIKHVPIKNNFYKFELWALIAIFGLFLKQGGKQIFEYNEIILDKEIVQIENISVSGSGNIGLML